MLIKSACKRLITSDLGGKTSLILLSYYHIVKEVPVLRPRMQPGCFLAVSWLEDDVGEGELVLHASHELLFMLLSLGQL